MLTAIITGASLVAGALMTSSAGRRSAEYAKRISQLQQQIFQQEIKANEVRREAMRLNAHRSLMEIFRTAQRARAVGQAAAVNQGASKGSGLQGGYGQVSGQTGVNVLGVTQNLGFGEQLFDINNQISSLKGQIAQQQGFLAESQGQGQLGNFFLQNAGQLGNLFGGIGGNISSAFAPNTAGPLQIHPSV